MITAINSNDDTVIIIITNMFLEQFESLVECTSDIDLLNSAIRKTKQKPKDTLVLICQIYSEFQNSQNYILHVENQIQTSHILSAVLSVVNFGPDYID